MASIRISQLASVTSVTSDDVIIINDGDVNTRKISYADFTAGLVSNTSSSSITGNITISGEVKASTLNVDNGVLFASPINDRVGIGTESPDFTLDVSGPINIRGGSPLRMMSGANTYATTIQAPATLDGNYDYTMPGGYPAESGNCLVSDTSGGWSWQQRMVDPMTQGGDLIYNDASLHPVRLPAGSEAYALRIGTTGMPEWQVGYVPVTGGGFSGNVTIGPNSEISFGAIGDISASAGITSTRSGVGQMAFATKQVGNNTITSRITNTGSYFGGGTPTEDATSNVVIDAPAATIKADIFQARNVNNNQSCRIDGLTAMGIFGTTGAQTGAIVCDGSAKVIGVYGTATTDPCYRTYLNTTVTAEWDSDGSLKLGTPEGTPGLYLKSNGGITVNGAAGSSGQVLTSGGPGEPTTWTTVSGGGGGGGAKGQKGQTGADGQKGTTGAAGDKGLKGEPGVDGSNGTAGSKGQKGELGTNGTDGQKGTTGATGDKGEKGAAGVDGSNGNDGSKGQKGTDGSDGADGQKGATGADGSNGTNGAKGQKGEIGVTGDKGNKGEASGVFEFKGAVADQAALPATGNTTGDVYRATDTGTFYAWTGSAWAAIGTGTTVKGEKGEQGVAGSVGTKGQKGQDGAQGTSGTNGTNGDKGQKGEDGAAGTNGTKGDKGAAGTDGTNGSTGDQGEKGEKGTGGSDGSDGSKGQKGVGQKGEPGVDGTNGTKGAKGSTGSQGVQGDVGGQGQKGQTGTSGTNGAKGDKGSKGQEATPPGSNNYVLFNNNGAVGASSAFRVGTTFATFKTGTALNVEPGVTTTVNGDITIGSTDANTVNLQSKINGDLIATSSGKKLGTIANKWDSVHLLNSVGIGTSSVRVELSASNMDLMISRGDGASPINEIVIGKGKRHISTNLGVGHSTMQDLSTDSASENTAIGNRALEKLDTGADCTAVGHQAGQYVVTGSGMTCIGSETGPQTSSSGEDNSTYVGYKSGFFRTSGGSLNTAIGYSSLAAASGSGNVALGALALSNKTGGGGNIMIGPLNSSGTYAPCQDLTSSTSHQIAIGSSSITAAYVKVAWTVTSDKRDKAEIESVPHGLDFVEQLKPTSFRFRKDRGTEECDGPRHYGFLAQEVAALEGDSSVIVDQTNPDNLMMRHQDFTAVLVNAIQELSDEVKTLKAQCDSCCNS